MRPAARLLTTEIDILGIFGATPKVWSLFSE